MLVRSRSSNARQKVILLRVKVCYRCHQRKCVPGMNPRPLRTRTKTRDSYICTYRDMNKAISGIVGAVSVSPDLCAPRVTLEASHTHRRRSLIPFGDCVQ